MGERESRSAYTAASFVGGLQTAALIARQLGQPDAAQRWDDAGNALAERVLEVFWSEEHGRFLRAVQSRSAILLNDPERTDLPATFTVDESGGPLTPLPQYPNWVTGEVSERDLMYDISVLALAVPFGVVRPDDPRMVVTMEKLRERLWSPKVGGYARYEGDTYGGGNVWPLATMWVACWEAARGNPEQAAALLAWMREHLGPNHMIAEQVHKVTGAPVAALPMAWSCSLRRRKKDDTSGTFDESLQRVLAAMPVGEAPAAGE